MIKRYAERYGKNNHKSLGIKSPKDNKLKCGKTSFAVKAPKNLLFAFEKGYNALAGIYVVDIKTWSDFKRAVRQLKQEDAKERYQTITIDTATIAYTKCEQYICATEGVSKISDIDWGQGYEMVKKEFENVLRDITMEGYGLICLAHSEEKTLDKSEEAMVRPSLNKRAYAIINGLVDIIGYISVEFNKKGESQRYLYTRSTPKLFAGSRFAHLPAKISFGYETLIDSLVSAIEKESSQAGTSVSENKVLNVMKEQPERDFQEVMVEAKDVWFNLRDDEELLHKAVKIIERNFGEPFKLSEATEEQQTIVESTIEDLKELQETP